MANGARSPGAFATDPVSQLQTYLGVGHTNDDSPDEKFSKSFRSLQLNKSQMANGVLENVGEAEHFDRSHIAEHVGCDGDSLLNLLDPLLLRASETGRDWCDGQE